MRYFFVFIGLLTLLSLASCATTSQQANQQAKQGEDQDVECKEVKVTGSNIPQKVCEKPDEKQDELNVRQIEDQLEMESIQRRGAMPAVR